MSNVSTDNILNMDATALAKIIVKKQLTIYEVVSTFITHAKKENAYINAIVEERFGEALQEAREKDAFLQTKQDVGPLFGVPISVKESFDVKGMKTTGGLIHLKDHIATEDAAVITNLKDAGAIILCKTNTPALCFCQETDNKLYGRTNNAWDKTRTAGGSSGGEAALLSVGGAAIGIGSDIGGSIRFPSHFNGVVGFKPGKYQVSQIGHFPEETIDLQQRMSASGPMGKSVRDMELMYELISTYERDREVNEHISINFLTDDQPYPLNDSTTQMMDEVASFTKSIGKVERTLPPFFLDAATIWQEVMSIDGANSIKKLAFPGKNQPYIRSYIHERITRNSKIHKYLSWALIGASMFKPTEQRMDEITSYFSQGDEELYAYYDNRVTILPVYHSSARAHGEVYKQIFSIKKTYKKYMPFVAYANVWGLPSLTIPIALANDNMPIAVQIVSRVGNEHLIFHIGKQLEQKFRGYKRSTEENRA